MVTVTFDKMFPWGSALYGRTFVSSNPFQVRTHNTQRRPIHAWSSEARPREKLISRGQQAVSDAELIAMLLSTGTRDQSAIELASKLIGEFGGLVQLAEASVAEMTRVHGIGQAKAATIAAAFELARRRDAIDHTVQRLDTTPSVASHLIARIGHERREVFYALFFDSAYNLLGERELFSGGIQAVSVDPRPIFKEAFACMAKGIVVAHNHPSGCKKPSPSDDQLTQHLVRVAETLGIEFIDHLIITRNSWYSYADQGFILEYKDRLGEFWIGKPEMAGVGRPKGLRVAMNHDMY